MSFIPPQKRILGTFIHDTLPGKVAQLELSVDREFIRERLIQLQDKVAAAVAECLPFHAVHWQDMDDPEHPLPYCAHKKKGIQ